MVYIYKQLTQHKNMMCIHNDLWVPGANLFIWIRTLFQLQLGAGGKVKSYLHSGLNAFILWCGSVELMVLILSEKSHSQICDCVCEVE